MFHYLSQRALCSILEPGASLSDFAVKASPEDWRRQGHVMSQRNLYQQACKCFQQSGDRSRASHSSLTSHSFHSPSTTHMAPCYRGMSGLVVVVVRRKGARLRDVAHGRAVHKSPPSIRFGRKLGGQLFWESIKPKGSEGGVCGRHLERTAGRRGSLPV